MKIIGSLIVLISCVILGNGQDSVSFLESNCGVTISRGRSSRYRIIGGTLADKLGNPWMALIISNVECGGSLITARFVLSAAHCMTGHPTTVHLGEYDRSRPSANGIQVSVEAQIPHPQYTNTRSDIKNDIGLFRLSRTVQYTDFIKPICLPTNYNPLAKTTHLTATGWGKTEHGTGSNVLKKTTLTQQSRAFCSSIFRTNVDTSQICAGAPTSHTCSGDSGGPITAMYSIGGRSRVLQLGIVSYGEQLCRTSGVYTNVMHYMSWITSVIRRGGGHNTPAPTQRPNHNNYDNTTPNPPTYYYTITNPPTYYYTNGNSPTYYSPNGNSPTYYLPNGNTLTYPNVNYPVVYYPQNYGVYG
ncbi:chymotrypsin-like protease CTRL-1 [Drosophila serrata]|uniref:chymotrypsin-like protease CTRL-1 n=1 Tax=Drosophila serrata TaxID=7274 RepID=UPI000A1D1D6C|nr:chymotrypsin-like protease CTRL-1 [Drosophila serrata]